MVYLDNLRPEQKLAQHCEESEQQEQLPLTRSKPSPHSLVRSLDWCEQVMGEQQETILVIFGWLMARNIVKRTRAPPHSGPEASKPLRFTMDRMRSGSKIFIS